ncbi:MAG: hypothetical protein EPN97_13810 [Alphaproteobacteria bacterium]|nr:MAG: hypothetical protein EPN97_13810 [Alphaproteobacteria bacterium]
MRNDKPRENPFLRSIILAFLTASLSGEALHHHEEHNPHGNRRERIEEARERLQETLQDKSMRRNFNSGGDPKRAVDDEIRGLIRRRRDSGQKPVRRRNSKG